MSYSELADRCSGRWPEIIAALCHHEAMHDAIARGGRRHGPCPVHGGVHGDAFRVLDDFAETGGAACSTCGVFPGGFKVIEWLNGGTWVEIARSVEEVLDGGVSKRRVQTAPRRIETPSERRDDAPPVEVLQRLWNEATPFDHRDAGLLRRYLEGRAIGYIHPTPTAIRLHPRMLYSEGKGKPRQHLPALIGAVTGPQGKLVALQRVYLDAESGKKANVSIQKKMLRARHRKATGAAVRLFPAAPVLGLAEGMETALAVHKATGMAMWATINTALMASLVLPRAIRRVVIWADADVEKNGKRAGQVAAESLRDRLLEEGKVVDIYYPLLPDGRERGVDWNDVLAKSGAGAFPKVVRTVPPLPSMRSLVRAVA